MAVRQLRVALFAPHFAEYSTRLAIALSDEAKVLFFLDKYDRDEECSRALMDEARRSVTVVEFDSRGRIPRNVSRLRVLTRINLFSPDVIHVQEQPDTLTVSIVRLIGRRRKILLTVHDPAPHSGN